MTFGAVSANTRNSTFSRLLFSIAYELFRGPTFARSPRGRNNTSTGTNKMVSDEDGEFLDFFTRYVHVSLVIVISFCYSRAFYSLFTFYLYICPLVARQ